MFYPMKVLIIGPLGAGKSTLAYQLNKKFNLPRLNLTRFVASKKMESIVHKGNKQFL